MLIAIRPVRAGILRLATLIAATVLSASPAAARTVTAQNAEVHASFSSNGTYQIHCLQTRWDLQGTLSASPSGLAAKSGSDAIGAWTQIDAILPGRVAIIRVYQQQPVVLFLDRRTRSAPNRDPFPQFAALPPGLEEFSYGVNTFAHYQFGKLGAQGPWVLFDAERNAMVLSPADHFLVADMQALPGGKVSSGVDPQIKTLPAGYEHGALLVLGRGIDQTLNAWGQALETRNGKQPVPNDADVLLNQFGYWTDHYATYYYKFEQRLGYEGTLVAVRKAYQKLGVPIAYMQLDSWWYPKEKGNSLAAMAVNGATVYRADPKIFPKGLRAYHQQLGLPFVVHARWIAPDSPYRHEFKMSNNVILSPKYWNRTAKYLHRGGVAVYEQDWLDQNARPAINLTAPQQFLGNMAHAMASQKIAIEYCMPLPGYFMASTHYQNLETIRVSDDGFRRSRWDWFLYGSALARAVGLWPWTDVFMSRQLPELILSTLSAGPVGVGDPIDQIDAANLKRVMRADSVLLKPDTSIVPTDATFQNDAANLAGPMVASTHSGDEVEVFAYPRRDFLKQVTVPLHEIGITGQAYAYDWVNHTGKLIAAKGSFTMPFASGWAYSVLAPVDVHGIAILGDTNAVVPLAAKRFQVASGNQNDHITVTFAMGESSVTLTGWARRQPQALAEKGSIGALHYNATTRLFTVQIHPSDHTAVLRLN
jgi:hypothetical protein